MFGFFFNKKSKSFDKDNNGKSSGGSKKSKDCKESTNGAGEGVSTLGSQNNSNSDSSSSGDFLLSSTTDSESSDLKTSHSTGSLPSNNNQYDDSDIQSAFNSHEDIPFHDEDTTEEEGDGCSGGPTKNPVVFSENRSFKNGPSREIPLANRRIPSNVSIADSNKLVRLSSSPTKSELSLKFQRERDASELERKTLAQLEEVRSKLLAKETEISILQADINMLTVDRDNKVVEMEGLATQIMVLTVENESALEKISKLEAEVEVLRQKNQELTEELLKKTEQLKNVETTTQKSDKTATDLQAKVKDLEEKLKDTEVERDKLQEERDSFESEREEELRAMQNALDDAIEAKIKIQNKFERDFEELRTTNASQEQQLMEDFEWKLRQIEQSCKKKLQEKDRQVEEKLKEARLLEVTEIGAEREQLRQERRQVEEQMREVIHLKSYEAEVVQLRGVVHEQQKALRAAARQLEHLKLNDKLLQDEIRTLKVNLEKEKAHSQVIQASNQRKFDAQEENLQSKLDKQKNELNALWEDRCREECTRLKEDLSKLHAEEKHLAVETMKIQKDQDLTAAKQAWERQREQLMQDISKLNDTITEKENRYHREVEKITAQADRDGWEMRRKLDKLTSGHMEQIEKLKESHEKEIDELKEVHEEALNRISELERQLQEAIKSHQQQQSQSKEPLPPPPASIGIPVEVQSITVVPINNKKQDSGSDSSEEEEETEESEASEEYSSSSSKAVDNGIDGLRKEVAHLQGSIEKLTSDLTQGSEDAPVSHSISTSATSQSCTSETAPSTGDTSGSGESDEDDDE